MDRQPQFPSCGLKYLKLNVKLFEETSRLWDKFDVVKGTKGIAAYGAEERMGWTAGVFVAFAGDLAQVPPATGAQPDA